MHNLRNAEKNKISDGTKRKMSIRTSLHPLNFVIEFFSNRINALKCLNSYQRSNDVLLV